MQKSKSISLTCESIQVVKGRMEDKRYYGNEAQAFAESKCIFVGPTSNWHIKYKDIEDVQINDEKILLKTKKLTVVFRQHSDATTIDQRNWEDFASKLQAMNQKIQPSKQVPDFSLNSGSSHKRKAPTFDASRPKAKTMRTLRRPRGVFGKHGNKVNTAAKAWKQMPWDENLDVDDSSDDTGNTKENRIGGFSNKKTPRERSTAKLVSAFKDKDFKSSDEENDRSKSDDDDDSLASEREEEKEADQQARKHHRKHISKLKRQPTIDGEDDDTDDEDIFDTKDLTTPAAQRVVSPSGTKTTDRMEPPVEPSSPLPKEEASQSKLSSYFQLRNLDSRTSFQPRNTNATPPDPKTPPRPTPSNETSARLIRAATSVAKKKHRLQSSHFFASPRSKRGMSPAERRYREMIGDSRMYNKTAEEEDPIEDSPSPSRKRVFHKNRLSDWSHPPTKYKGYKGELRKILLGPKTHIRFDLSGPLLEQEDNVDESPRIRLRGLRNLGNTCYLNSSLQMLYTCQNMISSIGKLPGDHLTKSVVEIGEELRQRSSSSDIVPAVNPRIVKEAMDGKTDKFTGYEQRDAHEFLNDLIDYMHEELEEKCDNEGEKKRLPTNDFCLRVQVCLKCNSCGYTRNKEEMYRHLSIDVVRDEQSSSESISSTSPVVSKASVEKSLKSFFKPEVREIKCEKCDDGMEATQTLRIISRPKVLLLHLKRFIVVKKSIVNPSKDEENLSPNSPSKPAPVEYILRKNKAAVALPPTLTLNPFRIEAESDGKNLPATRVTMEDSSNEYSLKSIVHHIGMSASSGHYTADAVRQVKVEKPNNESKTDGHVATLQKQAIEGDKMTEEAWFQFDDGNSSLTKFESIIKSHPKQQTAYMLLYTLNDSSGESMTQGGETKPAAG